MLLREFRKSVPRDAFAEGDGGRFDGGVGHAGTLDADVETAGGNELDDGGGASLRAFGEDDDEAGGVTVGRVGAQPGGDLALGVTEEGAVPVARIGDGNVRNAACFAGEIPDRIAVGVNGGVVEAVVGRE